MFEEEKEEPHPPQEEEEEIDTSSEDCAPCRTNVGIAFTHDICERQAKMRPTQPIKVEGGLFQQLKAKRLNRQEQKQACRSCKELKQKAINEEITLKQMITEVRGCLTDPDLRRELDELEKEALPNEQ